MTDTYQLVEGAVSRMRPWLQRDGGDLELVGIDGPTVRVRLSGVCAACPTSHMTLYVGVEGVLRQINPALRVELVK